jgi:hypothetical protein
VLFSIAAVYLAPMLFRLGRKYFAPPELTRNAVVAGAS